MAGVLEPIRNGKKPISNGQMKKLFDSCELGRGESKNPHNYKERPSFTLAYFLAGVEERINASL